jgi:hypothetical protein
VIVLSFTLLGFAVADLLRWSPEPVSQTRTFLASGGATGVTVALASLSGLQSGEVLLVGVVAFAVLLVWLMLDQPAFKRHGPGYPLAWIFVVVLGAFAVSGTTDPISGPVERWYVNLAFPFVRSVPVDQFVLGVSAALFLLATVNRVVRLVLEAAGTPAVVGETTLGGGRLLGPMERLLVGAMVLSGDLTGAAVVIAAKGLLRLPEIRDSADQRKGADDHVTEYFLIGTFCSLLLAGGLAAVVLGGS